MLIASRADVREELDRLRAHVAAARGFCEEVPSDGGSISSRRNFPGRRDPLATAKANDAALSRIGLELKAVVEQWREQVQKSNETPAQPSSGPKTAMRRGLVLIIASPSGAGKSTLSRLLLQTDPQLTLSVSVTTRPRRPSEVDGIHYHFIDKRRFEALRDRGELLEWAQVHGNFYGTPREPVETALEAGRDYLFDIDVQGTLQVYREMRSDVASVFIVPPLISELVEPLRRRAEDATSPFETLALAAGGDGLIGAISLWSSMTNLAPRLHVVAGDTGAGGEAEHPARRLRSSSAGASRQRPSGSTDI